jgi:hypothetical protein
VPSPQPPAGTSQQASTPPSPSGTTSSGATGTAGQGGSAGSTAGSRSGSASSRQHTLRRVRVSRGWVTSRGPRSRRSVRLSFWLSKRATVVIRIDQLAPECRYAGKLLVRGRRGRNVVLFRGRVRGRPLSTGTYRLIAHPRAQRSRRLDKATVVVFRRPPNSEAQVRRASARNSCPRGLSPSQRALVADAGAFGPGAVDGGRGPESKDAAAAGDVAGVISRPRGSGLLQPQGPIRKPISRATGAIADAAQEIPPALIAMAGLAVLLLALAAMPPPVATSRTGATLVHKRGSIALYGAATLVVAVVTYLLL